MDMNRLTEKSQAAFQNAQSLAVQRGHQEVDSIHLLAALLGAEDGLLPRLLTRLEVAPAPLQDDLETEMARRPDGCRIRLPDDLTPPTTISSRLQHPTSILLL